MPLRDSFKKQLDSAGIRYEVIPHAPAYTAPEIAAAGHVKGRRLVKCVMVSGGGKHWLVATTANRQVDLEKVRQALVTGDVTIEKEDDFKSLFPDCDTGAMPPFGNFYGVPVVADEELWEDEEIVFNGCDHDTLVKVRFADFEKTVRPLRADISRRELAGQRR
jgi:Ala-tRNA(Pro) deacylase